MANRKENYWSRHHWAIVQGVVAIYCAVLATWDRINPRPMPAGQRLGTSQGAASMTPSGYVMPFWLWIGIMALALSVVIPAMVSLIGRKKKIREAEAIKEKKKAVLDDLVKDWNDTTKNAARAGLQAGLLVHFYDEALHLETLLTRLWHDWDNEGEKLIYPLGVNEWIAFTSDKCIPLANELAGFKTQYECHLAWVKISFPGFSSPLKESDYGKDKYHDVLAGLKNHAELLNDTAQRIWDSESPMESLHDKA